MITRYVVHQGGTVNAKSAEVKDIYDASVLGYIDASDIPAARETCHILGLHHVYLVSWQQAGEYAQQLAQERGDIRVKGAGQ